MRGEGKRKEGGGGNKREEGNGEKAEREVYLFMSHSFYHLYNAYKMAATI